MLLFPSHRSLLHRGWNDASFFRHLRRADKQPVRAVVRQVEVLVGNRRKPNIPVDTSKESEVSGDGSNILAGIIHAYGQRVGCVEREERRDVE